MLKDLFTSANLWILWISELFTLEIDKEGCKEKCYPSESNLIFVIFLVMLINIQVQAIILIIREYYPITQGWSKAHSKWEM